MRERPFSKELENTHDCKGLFVLYQEIHSLLIKALNVDRRTVKQEMDKRVFLSRLELYSILYKKAYSKIKKVYKENGRDRVFIHFDDIIQSHLYVSHKEFESEEPERDKQKRSIEKYTTENNLTNELVLELQNEIKEQVTQIIEQMEAKKIFRRDDEEVIKLAVNNSLRAFLEKYKDYTTEESLSKAYHEVRNNFISLIASKEAKNPYIEDGFKKSIVKNRVSEEKETDPITPNQDPSVVDKKVVRVSPKEMARMGEESREEVTTNFRSLTKGERETMVSGILDKIGWEKKTKEVKEEVKAYGLEVTHYDDIYNVLEKVKKSRNG